MQPKYNQANWIQWVTAILVLVTLFCGIFYLPDAIENAVSVGVTAGVATIDIPEIPTATDIASAIQIPDVTEANKQLQEIWDELYSDEVEELENEAIDVCEAEFDWADVEDLLEAEFGDITEIEYVDFDEDNREITIKNLGLDDEDDRKVEIKGYFRVSYLPEEGEQVEVIDKVYGTCLVTSDEGELEADLTLRV